VLESVVVLFFCLVILSLLPHIHNYPNIQLNILWKQHGEKPKNQFLRDIILTIILKGCVESTKRLTSKC